MIHACLCYCVVLQAKGWFTLLKGYMVSLLCAQLLTLIGVKFMNFSYMLSCDHGSNSQLGRVFDSWRGAGFWQTVSFGFGAQNIKSLSVRHVQHQNPSWLS